MSESQLQKDVLVPLFGRMGYQDVHVHQGPTEAGKDLVMWGSGDFGQRMNFAVVAKATNVTGSASSSSGAGTLATQIRQCFGKDYLDHVTAEEQRINHVYVVSSKDISQVAIDAVKSALSDSVLDRCITFIDGEKLWAYVQELLPERIVLEELAKAKKLFDEVHPLYRITGNLSGDGITLGIEPKTPDAAELEPLKITGQFIFPDTPEGRKKKEEFERHQAVGTEVELTAEYIKEINMPEFMSQMFSPDKTKWAIRMGSNPAPIPTLSKITMLCKDGETFVIDYVPLVPIQAGEEEITLSNLYQLAPWKFELVYNRKARKTNITYTTQIIGLNVKRALDGLHFIKAVSKGGTLVVDHIDSGHRLATFEIPEEAIITPPEMILDLLEKLVFIQLKTGVLIPFLEDASLAENAELVFATAEKIENGHVRLKQLRFSLNRDGAKAAIDLSERNQPIPLKYEYEDKVILFGTEISLGPAVLACENLPLSEHQIAKIREALDRGDEEIDIEFNLERDQGPLVDVTYSRWQKTNGLTT